MHIFLVGFMGSGKTTIGRQLAAELGYGFIDLDLHIAEHRKQTIAQIFDELGETTFRELEHKYLREITKNSSKVVISTGGGTPCFGNNMEFINQNGISIYLKHSPSQLSHRLANSKNPRPLIMGKSRAEIELFTIEALAQREIHYNQASIVIDNPSRDITTLATAIRFHPSFGG